MTEMTLKEYKENARHFLKEYEAICRKYKLNIDDISGINDIKLEWEPEFGEQISPICYNKQTDRLEIGLRWESIDDYFERVLGV